MSERRRLRAGVEVQVDGDSVWLHVGPDAVIVFTVPRKYGGVDLITEAIPEEPTEPKESDPDFIDRRIANMERIWTATMEDLAARIETLENADHVRMEATDELRAWLYRLDPPVNLTPKEVMPDAGGSIADDDSTRDVAPPPGAEQDAPGGECACLEFWSAHHPECPTQRGGEEPPMLKSFWGVAPHATPIVEEVLEWLEDIESAFAASVTDAKMPRAAARIIREQKKKLENYERMRKYYRKHYTATTNPVDVREILWCLESISAVYPIAADAGRIISEQKEKIEELRSKNAHSSEEVEFLCAKVTAFTERLTITDEKVKAARGKVYAGSFSGDLGHVRAALRAAGMIDPEVG